VQNNMGKTVSIDNMVQTNLTDEASYCSPDADPGGCADRNEELPPPLQLELLEDGQTLELAAESGQLVLESNADQPTAHSDHLERARLRYKGYSRGNRSKFKRTSLLLPVGNKHGTTTQVRRWQDGWAVGVRREE